MLSTFFTQKLPMSLNNSNSFNNKAIAVQSFYLVILAVIANKRNKSENHLHWYLAEIKKSNHIQIQKIMKRMRSNSAWILMPFYSSYMIWIFFPLQFGSYEFFWKNQSSFPHGGQIEIHLAFLKSFECFCKHIRQDDLFFCFHHIIQNVLDVESLSEFNSDS